MKVSVAGAGFYGSTLAQRIAERDYADEVVLTDIVEGRPQGLALDLMHGRSLEGFETRVIGSNGYDETTGSDVGVVTAGLARKPGMSRLDLLEVNAEIVAGVTRQLVERSPDIVLIVVTNPLDEMTALAARVSGLPAERVMGQAGMLDTARFRHYLAEKVGVAVSSVDAMTIGSHGETMVPVPSLARIGGRHIREVLSAGDIAEVVERTRDAGAEVVGLLKTGSAYFAPSSAAEAMVSAVVNDSGEVLPVTTWVDGAYGIDGVFLGVPARVGRAGVQEVVELPLDEAEMVALRAAAVAVRARQADVAELG
ncbi:MAG TPA: malate dehydrogenase [Acidimicrobiales bacterium]|nr:malate dehydrogenase [Acidimicrobiales bacterium]